MKRQPLTGTEKFILAISFIIMIGGIFLFYTDLPHFEHYISEDGFVEWLTVAGLLMASFVCLIRFVHLIKKRNWWFLAVTILLSLFFFFVAGEEISWGQRILGIESSEFFEKNNAQGETNLHNLVVNGVKINKLIFSIVLVAVLGIYLLIFPILYHYYTGFRKFIDNSAIPIPRVYQIISILIIFGLSEIVRHGKRAELLEAGIALLVFLIISYPLNKKIFNTH